MRSGLRGRGFFGAAVIVLMLVAAVGLAYAATSGPGVVLGCAKNENGQLRVVTSAADCLASEHLVELQGSVVRSESVVVDCAVGDTVRNALARTATAYEVRITIKGTCIEQVTVARDNVTLQGDTSGGGLQGVWLPAARNIGIARLTFTGGGIGAAGAQFSADDVRFVGPGREAGVVLMSGAIGSLSNVTVDGYPRGISVRGSSTLAISGGSVIKNSQNEGVTAEDGASVGISGGGKFGGPPFVSGNGSFGVLAINGASIVIGTAVIEGNSGVGVSAVNGASVEVRGTAVVRNNRIGGVAADAGNVHVAGRITANDSYGVSAANGGRVSLRGASIDNNGGPGVRVTVGSSASIHGWSLPGSSWPTTITQNNGDGVRISGLSAVDVGRGDVKVTNNAGWGLLCEGFLTQTYVQFAHEDMTGNALGVTNCAAN